MLTQKHTDVREEVWTGAGSCNNYHLHFTRGKSCGSQVGVANPGLVSNDVQAGVCFELNNLVIIQSQLQCGTFQDPFQDLLNHPGIQNEDEII